MSSTSCSVPFHYIPTYITAPQGALIKVDIARYTQSYPLPGGYTAYLSMYADWNNDGKFDSVSERLAPIVELSPSMLAFTDSFYAPCSLLPPVRIRIMLSEIKGSHGAPCTANYGDAYDFLLDLTCPNSATLSGPSSICVGASAPRLLMCHAVPGAALIRVFVRYHQQASLQVYMVARLAYFTLQTAAGTIKL